ncbi:hypothetical protein V8F20_004126 [Naviculisporaceae sp. PSN 640]
MSIAVARQLHRHPPGPTSIPGLDPAAAVTPKAELNTDIRILFLLVALVSLAWSLYQLPLNRVVERRLCVEYYRDHEPSLWHGDGNGNGNEIPEEMCKVDEVQQGLGRIQGFMETGWVVGDFVMTIPLIAIADRYGHGVVLLMNLMPRLVLLGWTFAVGYFDRIFPVNAIIVAPLFSVLGGDCVFNSIVYSLVSGSTEDVVQRATYFGQVNAISSIFAYQLGPALASASMSVLLWLPLWLGMFLLVLAIPVVSLLDLGNGPKLSTLFTHSNHRRTHKRRESNELQVEEEEGSSLLHPSSSTSTPRSKQSSESDVDLTQSIRSRFYIIIDIVTTYPRNFTLLLTGFFLTSLASSDTKLLTQYISKRYHWKFTSVGYLMSGKAVFNFFLLYFIIPALLRWRERRASNRRNMTELGLEGQDDGKESKESDKATIAYAHICLVFSVLGALAIGASTTIYALIPSLLLYALGIALPMFTYSLLKSPSMLPPLDLSGGGNETEKAVASTAQIFSLVMLVKTSGMLVGAPLMASLWVYGVGVGGAGLGLPYFVSAVCYGLVVFIFTRIRV